MSIAGRLAALFLALAAITAHAAREFTDDSGRKVALPDRVTRVYAAGPPASVLVFALAPDMLIGWTRGFKEDEARWIAANIAKLLKLTGQGALTECNVTHYTVDNDSVFQEQGS